MTGNRMVVIAILTISAGAAHGAWASSSQPLSIDGQAVSTDVRTIDGRAYVPLADVAKYLNMKVSHGASGYSISTAGGAGQDNGAHQGGIGQMLMTGKWRFGVTGVETASEYQERYYQQKNKIEPKGAGDTLVIVDCVLKNALTKAQQPLLTERLPGNTGLADASGQSYAPVDYDARQESDKIGSYAAASMLPGAKVDFALVFSVPQGTTPSALVFTIGNYPDDVGGKGVDVRVSLK